MVISGLTSFKVELDKKYTQHKIDYYQEKINQWDFIFCDPLEFGMTEEDVLLRQRWVNEVIYLKKSLNI